MLGIIDKVADTTATVLISGESGTGKEIVARLLHGQSRRSAAPFVAVNCGAIAEGLQESELFGHVKGAFTGASERQLGKIEAAGSGTLFLDEIGETAAPLQVKLLRFLQFGEYSPVGCARVVTSGVRVIAATNRDLRQLVAAGMFRQDLYYRLHVVSITLPPLRSRPEDLPALIEYFLRAAARAYGRRVPTLTPQAEALLLRYAYPGNIRELENIIRSAVLLSGRDVIDPRDLPAEIVSEAHDASGKCPTTNFHAAKAQVIERFERRYLTQLLAASDGVVSLAARQSGLSERNLHAKLKQYGLKPLRDVS